MSASNKAHIWGVLGASGTGKGLWVKQSLAKLKPKRLIVWDYMNEYDAFAPSVATLGALQAQLIVAKKGPFKARYVPRGSSDKQIKAEFEVVCNLVYAFANCVYVAEELANVTNPSYAPAAWRKMTTTGRHMGIHIIGTSQSPAFIDKAFLGNCTLIHCSALREASHRKAVSKSADIPQSDIDSLQPLEWIEKDWSSGEVRRGHVKIPQKSA
jgi:hypothetical protein